MTDHLVLVSITERDSRATWEAEGDGIEPNDTHFWLEDGHLRWGDPGQEWGIASLRPAKHKLMGNYLAGPSPTALIPC